MVCLQALMDSVSEQLMYESDSCLMKFILREGYIKIPIIAMLDFIAQNTEKSMCSGGSHFPFTSVSPSLVFSMI